MEKKEEKKKSIAFKASQEVILIRRFNKFLTKLNESKKSEIKKAKKVTCYECKKPSHLRSECPRLKHKSKGGKEKRKAFKTTWTLPNKI